MSRGLILLGATALLPVAALATPQARAPVPSDGAALFREKCGMCHGKVGMGTGLLARRVQPAELLERTDLTAEYVIQAARTGIGNMPAIPRGEASDTQLRAIAQWLALGPKRR